MIVQIVVLSLFIVLLYKYSTQNSDYWEVRKIKYVKLQPFFFWYLKKIWYMYTPTESVNKICKMFPEEKMIGTFIGTAPVLIIKEPALVKQICVSDFAYFNTRCVDGTSSEDPTLINVFHAGGDNWKILRQRLTAAFTLKKIQQMFPLIVKCSEKLQNLGDGIIKQGGVVHAYELMSKFTMEFICACGMGVDIDVISSEHSLFFKEASQSFLINRWKYFMLICTYIFPFLNKTVNYAINPKIRKILGNIVSKVRKERNFKPCGRNDFIDYLLELEALGKITCESMEKKNPDGSPAIAELDISNPIISTAQVYVFYAAGYETSAFSTSYTLHQLAYHPDIQRRVQNQIDNVLQEYNNSICYEAVTKLTLLEMVFLEAMRMCTPVGIIGRYCTKRYTFPGTDVTIDPGTIILVAAEYIHNDEKHYDDPKEFRPERFLPEVAKRRNNFEYIPFGVGPRACIGSRLGLMQSLAGLTAVLQKFNVELAPNTTRNLKIDRNVQVIQGIEGGLPIKLTPRKIEN